jgi:hypothetical protein
METKADSFAEIRIKQAMKNLNEAVTSPTFKDLSGIRQVEVLNVCTNLQWIMRD